MIGYIVISLVFLGLFLFLGMAYKYTNTIETS